MSEWKRQANRYIRRCEEEVPSGNFYKKINDVWSSPRDGKRRGK